MVIFVLLVGTSCLTVDVLEEVVGVDAEIFDTTDDTEERSTGAEVSMILFPHMDFYNVMARIKQGGKRTFLRKHIQSWLLVRFRIEICIMQVSPVVRQAHESPGEWSRGKHDPFSAYGLLQCYGPHKTGRETYFSQEAHPILALGPFSHRNLHNAGISCCATSARIARRVESLSDSDFALSLGHVRFDSQNFEETMPLPEDT